MFHGLNTTIGQNFFEAIAHLLSEGEKREYTSGKGKLGVLQISHKQNSNISTIITSLVNNGKPDLSNENDQIFITPDDTHLADTIGFSADVFIENNTEVIAIEMKSVKPNAGEMKGEKNKILHGKAALYKKYPNKKIRFFIGFPFDPTNDPIYPTGYDKKRFTASIINMNNYFSHEEILLASELWDFLSGDTNTMQQLISIINDIATPEFEENLNFLRESNNKNIDINRYIQILTKWHLVSELNLVNNDGIIRRGIENDDRMQRFYYQSIFTLKKDKEKTKIHYNRSREAELKSLI